MFSNKKFWHGYVRPNGGNYNDCHIFTPQDPLQQQQQTQQQFYTEFVQRAETFNQLRFIPKKDEEQSSPSNLLRDSNARLGRWRNSIPDKFPFPPQSSPVRVRRLSEPVWRYRTAEEIAACGDGWNADYSLLKNMYYKNSLKSYEAKNLNAKSIEFDLAQTERLKYLNEILADDSLPKSPSSSKTLCNIKQQNDLILQYRNRENLDSSSGSSSIMETACGGITSSAETYYTASFRPQQTGAYNNNNNNNNNIEVPDSIERNMKNNELYWNVALEHYLIVNALKGLPHCSWTTQKPTTANYMNDFRNRMSESSSTRGRGRRWTERNRKFQCRNSTLNAGNFELQSETNQPRVQWSTAYNNFLNCQWVTTAGTPVIINNQLTTRIFPVVPCRQCSSIPNNSGSNVLVYLTDSFHNNLIENRLLQQPIFMQRQRQQQQQRSYFNPNNHSSYPQRRQYNFRNSDYKWNSQFTLQSNNRYQRQQN